MRFSIIIPVYNRPEELEELLESIKKQVPFNNPEIIVVEDGSSVSSGEVVKKYAESLNINYCFKKNSGPGDSRNYGMERATGDYFLLLDSDCILPEGFLSIVESSIEGTYTEAFGGPDRAHDSFSTWQKAVNYSMTSFLTTGGLRNKETPSSKFQLRSFNMGMSKKAFQLTGGFSKQRVGEDIDLNYKLREQGCSTRLIPEAFVFHKRRTNWFSFFKQTNNFGAARPILNRMHRGSFKLSYWFPSIFLIGILAALILLYFGTALGVLVYMIYSLLILLDAYSKTKSAPVAFKSVFASYIQFIGYGSGYVRTAYRLYLKGMDNKSAFPGMFA